MNSFWKGAPNDDVEMETFDRSQVTMQEIPFKLAKSIIVKHHYSKTFPSAELCLGFYVKEKLNAVIVYGKSATARMADSLPGEYLELVRLFSFDWAGKNMESYSIGQIIKFIKKNLPNVKVLISFADPEQGHLGKVYQATNWLYCGLSQPDEWYIVDDKKIHPRSMVAKFGTRGGKKLKEMGIDFERKKLHGKHRYIYLLGKSKKENRKLKQELQYEILSYPKENNE